MMGEEESDALRIRAKVRLERAGAGEGAAKLYQFEAGYHSELSLSLRSLHSEMDNRSGSWENRC